MWIHKGRELYNRSMKSFLPNNGIKLYRIMVSNMQHIMKENLMLQKSILAPYRIEFINT